MKIKSRRRKVPVTSTGSSKSVNALRRTEDVSKATTVTGVKKGSSANPATSAKIIRRFHVLLKRRAQLEKERDKYMKAGRRRSDDRVVNDGSLASCSSGSAGRGRVDGEALEDIQNRLREIEEEMERMGGLEEYQRMSSIGQGKDRGGGSEKVLIEWLRELGFDSSNQSVPESGYDVSGKGKGKVRLLEVGALKPDNYASCSSWIDVLPIDLRSQYPGIREQDFLMMDQVANAGKWDIISLSLVVNFVPDPKDRGKMLRYAHDMLHEDGVLFLALPLPCVSNSRYLTFEHLKSIMEYIGFDSVRERWKAGGKMVYWLFQKRKRIIPSRGSERRFDKKFVFREGQRNNFCILL